MTIPYRTQRVLKRIAVTALAVLIVLAAVWGCWFTWLQRYVVYSADGSVRQSGGLAFRLADAGEDASILTDATADARALLQSDPALATCPLLAARVNDMFDIDTGLIS